MPFYSGFRQSESIDPIYEVDGMMMTHPFRIVNHGPVNVFVEEPAALVQFYEDIVGFRVSERVSYQGSEVTFLRHSNEHHSLGIFPIALRRTLGLSEASSCLSYGIQVANYRQLKSAVQYLRDSGVRVETNLIPPELHPGIDYCAHTFDPEGNCLQLFYYMEQIGWDGVPRPSKSRAWIDSGGWPEVIDPMPDTFNGDPFMGPWA
jgi:predicted enzyme related to lactoylglutathione lyase